MNSILSTVESVCFIAVLAVYLISAACYFVFAAGKKEKAAAYVNLPVAEAPMPPEDQIDFVLDRPFLFVLRSRDDLPLLAEKYYRGKNASNKSGYGLGMYLCKTYMNKQGGGMEYYNDNGFVVELLLRKV